MHNTAGFCSHKSTCRLLDYIQGDCELHRSIPTHSRFERLAFDQFHRVETLTILFAVIDHPSNIWVTNIRSRTRFAQKTRSRARVLRDLAIDDLESNKRVQNCIARAISYGHRSRTELNRKTVCSRLYFEVRVSQSSGYQSAAHRWPFRLLSVPREGKTNEAPQTFAVRTRLSERSAAGRAGLRSFTLRFRGSEAHADVVHIARLLQAISIWYRWRSSPSISSGSETVLPTSALNDSRNRWRRRESQVRRVAIGTSSRAATSSWLGGLALPPAKNGLNSSSHSPLPSASNSFCKFFQARETIFDAHTRS